MSTLEALSRDEALAAIPDSPATLEFRSLARDRGSAVYRSGGGLLLVDPHQELVGAAGAIASDHVRELYHGRCLKCELVADQPARDALAGVIAFEPAKIFTLAETWRIGSFARADLSIRPLQHDDSIAHLPEGLRHEIGIERSRISVFTALVDGVAVSFSYSSSMTETLADISIDTLAAHRNRGIGAATAAKLIDWVVAGGRTPVWGAVDGNHASLRLAAKLGFTRPAGELFVCQSPFD